MKLALTNNSWGRAPTEEEAIKIAFLELPSMLRRGTTRIGVTIYDHEPYETIEWSDMGVFGKTKDGHEFKIFPEKQVFLDMDGKLIGENKDLKVLPPKEIKS